MNISLLTHYKIAERVPLAHGAIAHQPDSTRKIDTIPDSARKHYPLTHALSHTHTHGGGAREAFGPPPAPTPLHPPRLKSCKVNPCAIGLVRYRDCARFTLCAIGTCAIGLVR